MFEYFAALCAGDGVKFDPPNQRVRCLGHIMNLATQLILKYLKAEGPAEENDLLEDSESGNIVSLGTVGKVMAVILPFF
jgi:hypothetical protein